MTTYDPSDRICYVHLSGPATTRGAAAGGAIACSPLPSGYANQSPQTRLQRRSATQRGERGASVLLTARAGRAAG